MRLSKIKLAGFKSFVDPTTIHFPSNLIGVVGPNGCGKSNVIDAVRWVMGESSAKNLRGDSMDDVIFNGSRARKPVGQASIELIFDNSDGSIGGAYAGYSEVSIRRVLTREGTSTYFLNNTRCRRKDITHILLGTGLGPRSYSIIEQGMISRIVEARPEELRGFLEEAAGISKYKDRRRETENRMRHTRDNLERLNDLRDEVAKQLDHLKRQARAAERYRELKDEERRVEAELLVLRLTALKAEASEQKSEFTNLQTQLESAVAEQRAVEADIERQRVTLNERNDAFNAVQGDYYRVGADIARLEQSVQHRKELKTRHAKDLAETESQASEIRLHINRDQQQLSQLEETLQELGPGLEQANLSQRASAAALSDAELAMEQWRERWELLGSELAEAAQQQHVDEAKREQLQRQMERATKNLEKLRAEYETLRPHELEGQLAELAGREESLRAERDDASRLLQTLSQQIETLRSQDTRVAAELDDVRGELQAQRGRLASMEALQQAALGKTSSKVTAWLANRNLNNRPRLAQTLDVDHGWERAAETVLGAYLQAVCIDEIDDVAEALKDLTEGGITLVDGGDAHAVPTPSPFGMLAAKVRGPASIAALLRGVRTARSLSEALAMRASLRPDESVVTPEGVWIGPHWLRVNRSDDRRAGVLSRAEEIKKLRSGVAANADRASTVETALKSTREGLRDLEQQREEQHRKAEQCQNFYAEVKGELDSCRTRLEQHNERATSVNQAIAEVELEHRGVHSELEQCERRLEQGVEHRRVLETRRGELDKNRTLLQQQLTIARERADADRQLAQDIQIQVESRRSSRESAGLGLERLVSQLSQLDKRRDELNRQIEEAAGPIQEEGGRLESLLAEQIEVEHALGNARGSLEQADTNLRQLEERRTEKERQVSERRGAADGARLAVREAEVRAESVQEQFAKTEFDLTSVIEQLPEGATDEAWEDQLERVGRRIQRLGPINLAAIDEFKEQTERKEYLDRQFGDLTDALETLEAAIRKIDRETRAKFKDTFDKVNVGMGQLFPRLFGGGHAYLELEGEDLLNSGVTVMARPPGKRNSTIHLLSGGEKALTAVALVFSIFELNPAPFCLLDEVDAPLDDANVGRFCEIVKTMSDTVQFVIITHNKATMEMTRQLTGVTMNEPGVSRLVAVDIDEAVQLAAM